MSSGSPRRMPDRTQAALRPLACAIAAGVALLASGCGSSTPPATPTGAPAPANASSATTTSAPTTSTQATSPGSGKPPVVIGDKNYTEQFVLGELYYLALQGQGFDVTLNRNIGPTQVTLQALKNGQLGLYPEYLNTWNSTVAGNPRSFRTRRAAYRAAQGWALTHGLELLNPTPFSDTEAIGVTDAYAKQNGLRTIADLRKVAYELTLGVPPQFEQDPAGLPGLESAYGFTPADVKSLEIGAQYQALDQNTVQAADVNTTDAELTTGNYTLLSDPKHFLGIGNVVPVVPQPVLTAEGPAFTATVNRVTALLTLPVMRELNAQVDLAGQDPATVAQRFLVDHGLLAPPSSS
jgi:osmoprotectant transport system substrate-binding protein